MPTERERIQAALETLGQRAQLMYREGREQTEETSRPVTKLSCAPKPSLGKISQALLARETRWKDLPVTWRMGQRPPHVGEKNLWSRRSIPEQ
jgi:hypothetical protein